LSICGRSSCGVDAERYFTGRGGLLLQEGG